ncbi:MAG: N,N-dimethylformamidase, partial [Halioglobus sp.]
SENHGQDFILVPEEMLTHLTTLPGVASKELLRADIIWFDVAGGGSVFSVGSITFCGSLPHNGFDNSISTLLQNVVQQVSNR